MNSRRLVGVLVAFASIAIGSRVLADPIVAGTTNLPGTALMDLVLLPGTVFNPGSTAIPLNGVSGNGVITINRDTQIGDSIAIASLAGGMFFGSDPNLGDYVFGNIAPLTGADFSGVIENVVQDPSDPGFASGAASSFVSGDFSFGGNSFGFQFLSGPLTGVTLFTDPMTPFRFSSQFDGLPPSAGTVLQNSGPDVLDVLFNGQVVARSMNRRIVLRAVPEPASLLMLGVGAFALLGLHRRRDAEATAGRKP